MNTDECKKMLALAKCNEHYSSEDFDGISYNQLHKFWSELSPKARQELLRIDKQTLFEQASKNRSCSRCNGLLLEVFLQIGRSSQQKGSIGNLPYNNISGASEDQTDPDVHQWRGLTTTRDGSLTLLDCYLYAESFKGLQTVFESARARERKRELAFIGACGGGGRVWTSQGMAGYVKGHGTREACALHTMWLSCDSLVHFWSALGEGTRQSLLRMKEEDFVERLTYRFDCKKFCGDCRGNVTREFEELKELKGMQREPRCTDWFCVADTALRGQQCVHSRLVVGDGFVSIKRGECIRMFFEHAEEVEEEEDEVMIDKDGNEVDGECLCPRKHAKSPELAREFLLDAAMVIFKEQVEKALRERTARQNAQSRFVCLSSKLLEQRVHIACKEMVTLEKQEKLLEEEEKEKREEEERKERKRAKEREKKLRRKERLKAKEREKEQKNPNLSREEEGLSGS